MLRKVLAVVLGLCTWVVVATVVNRGLRLGWSDYALAEPSMAFTLGMLGARLGMGALSTLSTGAVAALVAREPSRSGLAVGVALLVIFVPGHIAIWSRFPVWYHVVFLGSLLPLSAAGAQLVGSRRPR